MKIALITLFPEMFDSLTEYGISGRAVKNGLVQCKSFNPREFTKIVIRRLMIAPTEAVPVW